MHSMRDRVAAAVSRYCMCRSSETIAVAVSGGADSIALLLLLQELALPLRVIHVDHQLRGTESDADRDFVVALATRLGIPVDVATVPVQGDDDNLEQAARLGRLDAFRKLIAGGQVQRVATGHTRDDQAETVLFRFLRGAHTAGLAGIRPVTREGLIRPLLGVSRTELRDYLTTRGETWREDSTNSDTSFRRNEIRHRLLPQLQDEWNPQLPSVLARLALIAQDEEEYWEHLLDEAGDQYWHRAGQALLCPVGVWRGQPRAFTRRLLRRAFEKVKGDLRQIDAEHLEAGLALFSAGEGHARLQVPGLDLIRSFDLVRIGPLLPPIGDDRFYAYPIAPPGCVDIPDEWRISLEIRNVWTIEGAGVGECQYNEGAAELDAGLERLQPPFVIRAWRPGDAIAVQGGAGRKKIKLLFQEFRVPLWERKSWPVLEVAGEVVWTRSFGVAAGCEATTGTRRVLRVLESKR